MKINKEHGPKASGCVTKIIIFFEEMPALYNIQKVSQNYFPFEQLSAVVYTARWVEEETMVLSIKALKNRKL